MAPRKKKQPVTVTWLDKWPLKDVHPVVLERALELADGNIRRLRGQSPTEIIVVNQERLYPPTGGGSRFPTMSYSHPEILRVHNRRIIAKRCEWPEGTAEKCEQIEAEFPFYIAWYVPDRGQFTAQANANADYRRNRPRIYGRTLEDIFPLIAADNGKRQPYIM